MKTDRSRATSPCDGSLAERLRTSSSHGLHYLVEPYEDSEREIKRQLLWANLVGSLELICVFGTFGGGMATSLVSARGRPTVSLGIMTTVVSRSFI